MPIQTLDRIRKALAGRYRVEREIGRGGMASVYLAIDERHERQVAVKVLLPELAAAIGQDRFIAEIRTTAKLQHPHVLPLLDSGEADSLLFYVTPYVAGETLADRLSTERQLPVEEAVQLTKAVAGALEHAHRNGIIHRDVKPSNILLQDGQPLVADFGIALALSAAGGGRLTETGLSLGTPRYMSPEQATGDVQLGPATDVYSLGCVLYEMLVGEPPFDATTTPALLARILTEEPRRPSLTRPSVPAHVEAAVLRSLEKLPADRFRDPASFATGLDDHGLTHPLQSTRAPGGPPPGQAWLAHRGSQAALVAIAVLVLALGVVTTRAGAPTTPSPPTSVTLSDEPWAGRVLSDDGLWMAHRPDPVGPIVVERLDQTRRAEIPVGGDAAPVGFSPDAQWLLIGGVDGLRRVPSEGGNPVLITEAYVNDADWHEDGLVAYVGIDGVFTVPWSGGTPERVHDQGYLTVTQPRFLPGGDRLLFSRRGPDVPSGSEVQLLDLASGEVRTLLEDAVAPEVLPPDVLLFGRAGRGLFGVPFEPATGRVTGEAVLVVDSVAANQAAAAYAVSRTGLLMTRVGAAAVGATIGQLVLIAPDGAEEPIQLRVAIPSMPRLSPDGRRIAYRQPDGQAATYDRVAGRSTPLPGWNGPIFIPAWHPSGDTVVLPSGAGNTASLVAVPIDGSPARTLFERPNDMLFPLSWPSEGRMLFQSAPGAGSDFDLEILALDPEPVASPYLAADWMDALGTVSPDGRWIAYFSEEGGATRIRLQSFPGSATSFDVSQSDIPSEDAISPTRWAPDGRTIYWQTSEGIMAAAIDFEPNPSVGSPALRVPGRFGPGFDVDPDGRLLLIRPIEAGLSLADGAAGRGERRTVLFVNWLERIRQAVYPDR